ncbi:MAG: hypothetical protein IPG91_11955 [Ideonella sp.]|nr:hypothetical protein [Ideonella sp.]
MPDRAPNASALPCSIWALGFVSLLIDVSSEMIHSLLPVFIVGTLGASAFALALLIAADLLLVAGSAWAAIASGSVAWGLHLAVTQGLLAAMVADAAPADLRGTAYGFFNLVSGVAMLIASVLAGLLWDGLGAGATFVAGALFAALALGGLWIRPQPVQGRR